MFSEDLKQILIQNEDLLSVFFDDELTGYMFFPRGIYVHEITRDEILTPAVKQAKK